MVSRTRTQIMCLNKAWLRPSENPPDYSGGERKPEAVKAAGCSSKCVLVVGPEIDKAMNLALPLPYIADVISQLMRFIMKRRPWRSHIQMFAEKLIVDCRFFTLPASAGSLLGSVLCFVEGCFLILQSYFQYFLSISHMSEKGHVVLLLIEAIDMFLVGTAMLIFWNGFTCDVCGTKQSERQRITAFRSKLAQAFQSPETEIMDGNGICYEKPSRKSGMLC